MYSSSHVKAVTQHQDLLLERREHQRPAIKRQTETLTCQKKRANTFIQMKPSLIVHWVATHRDTETDALRCIILYSPSSRHFETPYCLVLLISNEGKKPFGAEPIPDIFSAFCIYQ